MTPLRHAAGTLLLVAGVAIAALAGTACVFILANGVLATAAPAWTTELTVADRTVELSVPGLVRLATAPGMAHLLDGRSVTMGAGRITFHREGTTLVARCIACRIQHPAIAASPLRPSRIELSAERTGASVRGRLAVDAVQFSYVAELASDRIRLRWQLTPTDMAAAYRAVASIVPEGLSARIEGALTASGSLDLPSGQGWMQFSTTDLEVGGLGTEALQFGWFAMSCRQAGGEPRRVVTGDGEMRWIPLDSMGPLLPAAVIAAEDQRFNAHAGFDDAQVAALLAHFDFTGPGRGASTLTQQLARTLYTGGEKTAARKLREFLYAVEMERTLGKPRILELYLNTVDWGPGLCGARSAARTYFRKRPNQLTPLEAAWLAGILRAPQRAHEEQFLAGRPETERARWVLMQMRALPKIERTRWAGRTMVFAVPAKKAGTGIGAASLARSSSALTTR